MSSHRRRSQYSRRARRSSGRVKRNVVTRRSIKRRTYKGTRRQLYYRASEADIMMMNTIYDMFASLTSSEKMECVRSIASPNPVSFPSMYTISPIVRLYNSIDSEETKKRISDNLRIAAVYNKFRQPSPNRVDEIRQFSEKTSKQQGNLYALKLFDRNDPNSDFLVVNEHTLVTDEIVRLALSYIDHLGVRYSAQEGNTFREIRNRELHLEPNSVTHAGMRTLETLDDGFATTFTNTKTGETLELKNTKGTVHYAYRQSGETPTTGSIPLDLLQSLNPDVSARDTTPDAPKIVPIRRAF